MNHARPKPNKVAIVLCLAGAALTGYWAYRYEGVYRWLAELQLRWWGSYEVQITFLLTLAIVALPPAGIAFLIRRFVQPSDSKPNVDPAPFRPDEPVREPLWLKVFGFPMVCGIIGIALGAPGVYFLHRGNSAGAITEVAAADFDAGRIPTAKWVAVSGDALMDAALSVTESHTTKYYVPVISEDYDPKHGISLYLEAHPQKIDDAVRRVAGAGRFEGMLTMSELPGMVRVEFEKKKLAPAANYHVLDLGRTPADDVKVGRDMVMFGGVAIAVAIAIPIVRRLRQRSTPVWTINADGTSAVTSDARFTVKAILPLEPPKPPPSTNDPSQFR
jgi:hypothetical protein